MSHCLDFVTKEHCFLIPSVGNERLFRGQGEFEVCGQKFTYLIADNDGLCLWSYETQKEIIGVTDVSQASICRVNWRREWNFTSFPPKLSDLIEVGSTACVSKFLFKSLIFQTFGPAIPSCIRRY